MSVLRFIYCLVEKITKPSLEANLKYIKDKRDKRKILESDKKRQ